MSGPISTRATRSERGLTLVELMVTIAIIGVLAATVGLSMGRTDRSGSVDLVAQRLRMTLRQARNTAVDTGCMVCVEFVSATHYQVVRSSQPGTPPPTTTTPGQCPFDPTLRIFLSEVRTSRGAQIEAVNTAAIAASTTNPGTTISSPIVFAPDGTVQDITGATRGFTVYLRDEVSMYRQKVLLFGMTGYSHVVTRW